MTIFLISLIFLLFQWVKNIIEHIPTRIAPGEFQVIELEKEAISPSSNKGWVIPCGAVDKETKEAIRAKQIAGVIEGLLSEKEILDSTGKRIQAKDIMVLFRKRSIVQQHLVKECKERKIPVGLLGRMKLQEHPAIVDLVSLLSFIAYPYDELNLTTLLKSPIVGLSEEELFEVAYNREPNNLWENFQLKYPDKANYLKDAQLFEYSSINQLVAKMLFEDKKLYDFEKRFGSHWKEVIDLFLGKVENFDLEYPNRGISFFLHWFSRLQEIELDSQTIDSVSITTIHSAKGLESPVVILADASESENLPVDSLIWHDQRTFYF